MASAPPRRKGDGLPLEIVVELNDVGLVLKGLGVHRRLGNLAHQVAAALADGLAALLAHEGERHRLLVGRAEHAAFGIDVKAGHEREHLSQLWRALGVAQRQRAGAAVVLRIVNPDIVVCVALAVAQARRRLDLDGSGDVVRLEELKRVDVGAKREVSVLHAEESITWHVSSFQCSNTLTS